VIPDPDEDSFRQAAEADLEVGEQLVAFSRVYLPIYVDRPSERFGSVSRLAQLAWRGLALTTIRLVVFEWRTEQVVGWFRGRTVHHPEVTGRVGIPLATITTHRIALDAADYETRRELERDLDTKDDLSDIVTLSITADGESLGISSPFDSLLPLAEQLEATLAGAALADRTATLADSLAALARLHADGILTDDELAQAKAGFVGARIEIVESSASLLRQLADLHRAGVLTDSEFRTKKWDILSRPG
jgi:hypothetical protein